MCMNLTSTGHDAYEMENKVHDACKCEKWAERKEEEKGPIID